MQRRLGASTLRIGRLGFPKAGKAATRPRRGLSPPFGSLSVIRPFLPASGRRALGKGRIMSVTDGTRRELPARPSKEHLRKQAKRLAVRQSLGLAQAQRKIATGYGFATWADLMHRVDIARGGGTAVPLSPLAGAA